MAGPQPKQRSRGLRPSGVAVIAAEHHRGVLSPEAEGVDQGRPHLGAAGDGGHVVQVALRVGVLQVDGGRDNALVDGEHGRQGRQGAGAPQQVPHHGLGRADGHTVGMLPQGPLDGQRLGHVVQGGAGAVGDDVVHLLRLQSGRSQGAAHGPGRHLPRGFRGGDVVGVAGEGAPGQLGVDAGAAGQGVLQPLHHQGHRPLAEDEAVAVAVEGAAGALGVVVAAGEGAHVVEGGDGQGVEAGLAAADDDHVRLAAVQDPFGLHEGVGAGGTGRHRGDHRPPNPVAHGDLA